MPDWSAMNNYYSFMKSVFPAVAGHIYNIVSNILCKLYSSNPLKVLKFDILDESCSIPCLKRNVYFVKSVLLTLSTDLKFQDKISITISQNAFCVLFEIHP